MELEEQKSVLNLNSKLESLDGNFNLIASKMDKLENIITKFTETILKGFMGN